MLNNVDISNHTSVGNQILSVLGKDNRLACNYYTRSVKTIKEKCDIKALVESFKDSDINLHFYMVFVARAKQKFKENDG